MHIHPTVTEYMPTPLADVAEVPLADIKDEIARIEDQLLPDIIA
jgi:hypothetical protein